MTREGSYELRRISEPMGAEITGFYLITGGAFFERPRANAVRPYRVCGVFFGERVAVKLAET